VTVKLKVDDQEFDSGYYYPLTVSINGSTTCILDTILLWKEEAFGLVIVVVGFSDEDETINLWNDSEF